MAHISAFDYTAHGRVAHAAVIVAASKLRSSLKAVTSAVCRPAGDKTGIFQRALEVLFESNVARTQRDIDSLVSGCGGRFNDALEFEIGQRIFGQGFGRGI